MQAARSLPSIARAGPSAYRWDLRPGLQQYYHAHHAVARVLVTRRSWQASNEVDGPLNQCHHVAGPRQKQRRPQLSCRAASAPMPLPPPPADTSGAAYAEHQNILLELSTRKTFQQLRQFLDKHAQVFDGAMMVYALLQAANLRATIDLEALQPGMEGMTALMEAEAVLDRICDTLKHHVLELPADTQAAVVMALAQLDYYDGDVYSRVAQAAGAGPLQCAPQALPANLSLLCCAFALAGHYDADLLDCLGEQVAAVAAAGKFTDTKLLVNTAASFLDLQHYCGPLLQAVADAALARRQQLELEDLLTLALVAAFFKAGRRDLIEAALARLAGARPEHMSAKNVDFLHKLLLLVQGQVEVPHRVQALLQAGIQQHGPELAARPRPGLLDEQMLVQVEAAGGAQVFEMMGQSGFMANAQLFRTLQGLGFRPERNRAVAGGLLPIHIALKVQESDVAVQILTDIQYCKNDPGRLKGQAAAELLCLEMLGWVVLPVATMEWVELRGQEGREAYIVQRLKAVTS